jgi:hypothetical protein
VHHLLSHGDRMMNHNTYQPSLEYKMSMPLSKMVDKKDLCIEDQTGMSRKAVGA